MSKVLVIESEQSKKTGKFKRKIIKSRSFESHLICYVEDKDLGNNASKDTRRPIFMMFGATEQQARTFQANFRTGRVAEYREMSDYRTYVSDKFEVLKSSGFRWTQQKVPGVAGSNGEEVVVTTVYDPNLFLMEPALKDPETCRFIIMPPLWWRDKESLDLQEDKALLDSIIEYAEVSGLKEKYKLTDQYIALLIPEAAYFNAFLNARNKKALPGGLEFQLQLYLSALDTGVAQYANRPDFYTWGMTIRRYNYGSYGLKDVGLDVVVITNVNQNVLNEFLDRECEKYGEAQRKLDKIYPERLNDREFYRKQRLEESRKALEMQDRAALPDVPLLPQALVEGILAEVNDDPDLKEELEAVEAEVHQEVEPVNTKVIEVPAVVEVIVDPWDLPGEEVYEGTAIEFNHTFDAEPIAKVTSVKENEDGKVELEYKLVRLKPQITVESEEPAPVEKKPKAKPARAVKPKVEVVEETEPEPESIIIRADKKIKDTATASHSQSFELVQLGIFFGEELKVIPFEGAPKKKKKVFEERPKPKQPPTKRG
jgi:hypothetical protein